MIIIAALYFAALAVAGCAIILAYRAIRQKRQISAKLAVRETALHDFLRVDLDRRLSQRKEMRRG